MNVLLTGATGFLGRHIAAALVEGGHEVTPASRRHGVDFTKMIESANWIPHLEEIDAVINCVGIIGEVGTQRFEVIHAQAPIALFNACAQAGIRRVIQISAIGTESAAFSKYHQSKLIADNWLRSLDLDWIILRPALIYGADGVSTNVLMRLARLPLIPIVGDGKQVLQPMYVDDVATAVVRSLSFEEVKKTIDLVGSENISYADWMQILRQAQGLKKGLLLRIPYRLAVQILRLGCHISPVLHPDNLRMLRAGYLSDVVQTMDVLGCSPRRVENGLFFSDTQKRRAAS